MARPGDTYRLELTLSSSGNEVIGLARFFYIDVKPEPGWFATAKIIDGKTDGARVAFSTIETSHPPGNSNSAFTRMQFQGVVVGHEIHLTGVADYFISKGIAHRVEG